MLYSASLNAWQTVFSKSSYESTAKWETCQIFKEGKLLVQIRQSICNQNGHYIRCTHSSSSQGYDSLHKSRENQFQLRGIVAKNQN